jgi:hypothetical protein
MYGILIGDFNFEGFDHTHGAALLQLLEEFDGREVELVEQGQGLDGTEQEAEWTRSAFDSVNRVLHTSAIDRAFVCGKGVSALSLVAAPLLTLANDKHRDTSDHGAIGLSWIKVQHTKRFRSTPNFLPEHEAFLPAVTREYKEREAVLLRNTPRASGQARWRVFTSSVRVVSQKLSAIRKCTMSKTNRLIGAAAGVASALGRGDWMAAGKASEGHGELRSIIEKHRNEQYGDAAALQEALQVLNNAVEGKCNLLATDFVGASEASDGGKAQTKCSKPAFLEPKQLKKRIFSTKVMLTEVVDGNGVVHSTPRAVAVAVGDEYANNIWAPSPSSDSKIRRSALARKLRRAVKRLEARVDKGKLHRPTLQQVPRDKIMSSRASSAGPDGLSMPVIRAAVEITVSNS